MTGSHVERITDPWELEGMATASLVTPLNIVLIAGTDPVATARTAVGLAREESQRRPVTLTSLCGDLPELRSMADNSDLHGLTDHFEFGASYSTVTRPVRNTPTMNVIFSGSDDMSRAELLEHPHWERFMARYRDTGALLVLIANYNTPGIDHFSSRADGVLLGAQCSADGFSNVLRVFRRVIPSRTPVVGPLSPTVMPAVAKTQSSIWHPVQRYPLPLFGVLAVFGVLALAVIPAVRQQGTSILARLGALAGAAQPSSSETFTGSWSVVANPADSLSALAYTVQIATMNSWTAAVMRAADLSDIPGTTVMPFANDGVVWFRITTGALATSAAADSLQKALRARGATVPGSDRVLDLPYALQLSRHTSLGDAEIDVARYISAGIPAYSLVQENGSVVVFAGSFGTIEQGKLLFDLCASRGVSARLAFRTGNIVGG